MRTFASQRRRRSPGWAMLARQVMVGCLVTGFLAAGGLGASASARSVDPALATVPGTPASSAFYRTTLDYMVRFYPRFLSFFQQRYLFTRNHLSGPRSSGPKLGIITAANDDTSYAATWLDITRGPLVLTIPPQGVTKSSLNAIDVWGEIIQTVKNRIDMSAAVPRRYLLVPAGYTGVVPRGMTKVSVPVGLSYWLIRANRWTPTGQNETQAAMRYRDKLRLATLSQYRSNPDAGAPTIVPTLVLFPRMKAIADRTALRSPIFFLRQLQQGLRSPTTQPLTAADIQVSNAFNSFFPRVIRNPVSRAQIARAVRDAHALIVGHFQNHTVKGTQWVHFNNTGEWGNSHFLDRSAVAEFLQYASLPSATKYWSASRDGSGAQLDTSHGRTYTLTMTASPRTPPSVGRVPDCAQFWSLTVYNPRGGTMVPNPLNKWTVGVFTHFHLNANGSFTIVFAHTRPQGVPEANWLPTPNGPLDMTVRCYGPEGNTAGNTYAPPPIMP